MRLRSDEKSLMALLQTRRSTHTGKELSGLIGDIERQLVKRARAYLSASSRNLRYRKKVRINLRERVVLSSTFCGEALKRRL